MLTPEDLNDLHKLDDDVLVNVRLAAAFLSLKTTTLDWNRNNAPHRGPKWHVIGSRMVRYRMGDLRAHVTQKGG
ncbi:MAG: DNA-binding protein [Pseudomonadota bacterium]|nr:DNA-binding protein [Pseudomonadota bacterium]